MAKSFPFTADNVGGPDAYTVQTVCEKIKVREQDRTVATLAQFNAWIPDASAAFVQHLGGEEFALQKRTMGLPNKFLPGEKPFSLETVNVASTVFTIIEE